MRKTMDQLIAEADSETLLSHVMVPKEVWAEIITTLLRDERAKNRNRATLSQIGYDCPIYTPREAQIVALVHSGLSDSEIADRLSITKGTAKVMLMKAKARFTKWQLSQTRRPE